MSKTNLQKLQATRAGIRSTISMFIETAEELKEQLNIAQFRLALEKLEMKMKALSDLNEKIMSATDVEHIEDEILNTETEFFKLEVKLMGLRAFQCEINESESNVNRNPQNKNCENSRFEEQTTCDRTGTHEIGIRVDADSDGNQRDGTGSRSDDVGRRTEIQQEAVNAQLFTGESHNSTGNVPFNSVHTTSYHRLPKLTLPNFDGDIQHWQTFWDSFESTVHHNYNLTDVQKFSYLKSQLEGEAARTIDGFALTHINYARAIDLLKERYGQRHKIIHATMQALIQLPAPSSNLHSLRKFYDDMETKIRALESLGKPQENYGDVLMPIVLDKLPGDIREHLARQHGDDWLLSDLRYALFKEINIKEAGASNMFRSEVQSYGTAASLFAGASRDRVARQQRDKRQPLKCLLCGDSHVAHECRKYLDVQSKLKVVKEKKLCFNCFGKHAVFSCKSRKHCQHCGRKHHTTICQTDSSQMNRNSNKESQQTTRDASVLYTSARQSRSGVILKTAVTEVCYKDCYSSAALLFDEGAQRSFITETLADEIQLQRVNTEAVILSAFGGSCEKVQHIYTSTVYVITEQKQKIPVKVLIVPTIAMPIDISHRSDIAELSYLKGIKLAHPILDDKEFQISILIGADFYWDFIEDEIIRGSGPTAVKSKLGYLLSGPFNKNAQASRNSEHILNVMVSKIPDELSLERFWNLESLGITENEPNCKLKEEMQQYQQTSIEYENGKYTARLPWRPEHPELPTNYNIVLKRTESTIRRLAKEPEMLKKYGDIIAEQVRRGFIEKIPNEEYNSKNQVHYIPHHPVKKESSTTPIRIVYDCSSKQTPDTPSLNDCLLSTPPVLNELTSILLRFRLHRYAITTDIEKVFLNVNIHPDDRDVTRFLWLRDPRDPCSELLMYRFRSVLFDATSSPFILNATILKHLEANSSIPAAEILQRDLYVDNVISSFKDDDQCAKFYKEARTLMSSAGMNLRLWNSNSKKLLSLAERDNVIDTDDVTKVLGLRWDPFKDVLSFAKREIPISEYVTKRYILKHSSQIYDPLGILSPVTVRAKILKQEIWKQKFDWDVHLPENIQDKWNSLAKDLNRASQITFLRQFLSNDCSDDNHLHIFVDASLMSYGAAAFISNKEESRLIMAKNRVAPLKTLTLPKLELMAALIGARLVAPADDISHCRSDYVVR